jgi:hypothetical protein
MHLKCMYASTSLKLFFRVVLEQRTVVAFIYNCLKRCQSKKLNINLKSFEMHSFQNLCLLTTLRILSCMPNERRALTFQR